MQHTIKILGLTAIAAILSGCADERPYSLPTKVESIADVYPHTKTWKAQHIQHLVMKASKGESNPSNCLSCHESRQVKRGPKLGDEISCGSSCHTSEKAVTTPTVLEACSSCHTSDAHRRIFHSPMRKNQECTTCHSVHNEKFETHLKFDTATQCSSCHEPISHTGKSVHSMVAAGTCTTCHGVHGKYADPLGTLGSRGLCLSCHKDMQKKLSETTQVHGPTAAVSCTDTCHDPHASPNEKLLTEPYPLGLYNHYQESPNTYGLCFKCHDSAMLNPTDLNTQFRSRSKNLHWLHVVNGSGNPDFGRSCNICHDPHASQQSKLVRKSWLMGQYQAPLEFKTTPNGGTCTTACHSVRAYDRESDQ